MFLSKSLWLIGLAIIATAVWGNSYYNDLGLLYRVLGVIVLFILGLFVLRFTEFGSLAFETIKQSTTEIRKVVWPNRTETTQTTLIVVGVVIKAKEIYKSNKYPIEIPKKLVLGRLFSSPIGIGILI